MERRARKWSSRGSNLLFLWKRSRWPLVRVHRLGLLLISEGGIPAEAGFSAAVVLRRQGKWKHYDKAEGDHVHSG